MWRLYLTNFWFMCLGLIALPYLLIRFRHGDNTSLFMYLYAVVAERISGIRIEVTGRENILPASAVYVLNHQSSLDALPLGKLRIPRLAIIGKKEIAYIPILGWDFYLAGNVLLNRADGRKAKGQLDAGVEAIQKRRMSIAIFPEGTRNKDGILPFKKGGFLMAIDAGVPIVPVVIQSFRHVYDKATKTLRSGVVHVKVLPAHPTRGLQHKDAASFTQKIEKHMQVEFQRLSIR